MLLNPKWTAGGEGRGAQAHDCSGAAVRLHGVVVVVVVTFFLYPNLLCHGALVEYSAARVASRCVLSFSPIWGSIAAHPGHADMLLAPSFFAVPVLSPSENGAV